MTRLLIFVFLAVFLGSAAAYTEEDVVLHIAKGLGEFASVIRRKLDMNINEIGYHFELGDLREHIIREFGFPMPAEEFNQFKSLASIRDFLIEKLKKDGRFTA